MSTGSVSTFLMKLLPPSSKSNSKPSILVSSRVNSATWLAHYSILNMEAVSSTEISANFSRLHGRPSQKIELFMFMKDYSNQYAHIYILSKYFDNLKCLWHVT
jgi:competence transcription factor ComK